MQPKWIALVMSVLIFSQAAELMALKPSRNHHLEILPEREEASFQTGNMRVSTETGAPLALYRVNYRVMPDTPPNMAWQYLRENAELLKLKRISAI